MRLLVTFLTALGLLAGPAAYAQPPVKGTQDFKFRDPLAPRASVVVCESMDLLKAIARAQNHVEKYLELHLTRNNMGKSLCFALAFTGDVLGDPVPLGKLFFPTHMSESWGIYVRLGNFEGYALYTEPVLNSDGRAVQTRAS